MDTIVLLHGHGDDAASLASVAELLRGPSVRVVVPEAPYASPDGGLAWWFLEPDDRPRWAWPGVSIEGYKRHHLVDRANARIRALIDELPDHGSVCVAGFSQGAMLALDVALTPGCGVAKVVALSGVLLADTVPYLTGGERPDILVAHGRHDDEIPYEAGEAARDLLTAAGLAVEWVPFEGGHSVPGAVAERVRDFLSG